MSKKVTMKRVDTESSEEFQKNDKDEMREKAKANVKIVSAFGGTTVVIDDESDAVEPEVTQHQAAASIPQVKDGIVTAVAPDHKDDNNMEEVLFDKWSEDKKSDLSESRLTASQLIQELVGKDVATAENLLSMMQQRKEITSFRVVPIGVPMSMEFEPGRVQVLRDHGGNVVDVEIS